MAAIAYRRRALPVCWQVRRKTGVSDADQQKSLADVFELEDAGAAVLAHVDGFHG